MSALRTEKSSQILPDLAHKSVSLQKLGMVRQGKNPTYIGIKSSIWQRQTKKHKNCSRKYRKTIGENEILSLPGIPYFLYHSLNFILCPNFLLQTSFLNLYLRGRNN